MTGTTDDHWGERTLRQRTRRQWLLQAAMIALGLVFVAATRSLIAANRITHTTEAVIAVGFCAVIAVLGLISWRRGDEIQRRVAMNAYGVMGITFVVLIPLAGGIGPMLGWRQPALVAYFVAVLTVPVSIAFQRLRG